MISKETCALDIAYGTCWFYLHYHIDAPTLEDAYNKFKLKSKMDKEQLVKLDENVRFLLPEKKDIIHMSTEYLFIMTVGIHNLNFCQIKLIGDIQQSFMLAVENSDVDYAVYSYINDYKKRMSEMNEKITGTKKEVELLSFKTKELKPSKIFVDNTYDIEDVLRKNLYSIQIKVKVQIND